jgi:hypothetical protein
MRFVLCFFGLIASTFTAGLGVFFLFSDDMVAWAIKSGFGQILEAGGINENSTTSLTNVSFPNAALVTLAAAAYGFLGSILTMFRCGKQGGSLLLIPVLGAAFMNPISLVVTWFQALIALGCFFIGPLPINLSADNDSDDEEEKPKPKVKPKAKPKKFEDNDE